MYDPDLTSLACSVVGERARLERTNGIDLGLVAVSSVHVLGNEEGLRILLNDLVDNAIRFAGPHARVDVVAKIEDGAPVLMLCDTGPGIAVEDRERVWERFYRVSGHGATGSGLGLSIVRRIVGRHQTVVVLDSGLDSRGLTVRLRFPKPVPESSGPRTLKTDQAGAPAVTVHRPA